MQDLLYADGFDRLGERGGEAGIALRHRPSRRHARVESREQSGRVHSPRIRAAARTARPTMRRLALMRSDRGGAAVRFPVVRVQQGPRGRLAQSGVA